MADRDEEREKRIEMEIIVDAYTQDEQAVGWITYLEETMDFPFEAQCIEERKSRFRMAVGQVVPDCSFRVNQLLDSRRLLLGTVVAKYVLRNRY
ncbi:MAG: calcium-binding protein [Natrinema limicola]